MMLNTLLPILLFAALGLAVLGAGKRFLMWRRGRPAQVDWLGGLLAMPRRYMVDLHHVVARDKYIANTHVATAGGFVLAAVLAIVVHGFGLHSRILGVALLAACALMFGGALFVAKRRLDPPSRLSKGPWMRLPKSLLMFSVSFFIATLPVAGILPEGFSLTGAGGWILALLLTVGVAWGVSELFFGMTWGGPMKHAFAGALHLAWHRRSERFGGGRSTGLKALNLDDPLAPLGVEKPTDFTWNQLLGFDACVQCGKCEAACPAFAAGQPLNPKKLIQDMVVGLAGGTDAKFAGSPYPGKAIGEHSGGPHLPIVNLNGKALVDAETLWSCTTCRACVEECPMMIEHVDAIVDMRRHLTLEKGATPNKGAEVLENLIATDNPGGFAPGGRMNWAADLNLPLSEDGRLRSRFVMTQQDANSFRDNQSERSRAALANFEFDLDDATTLGAGYQYEYNKVVGGGWGANIPIWYRDGSKTDLPRSTNLVPSWSFGEYTTRTAFGSLEHRFDNDWKLKLMAQRTHFELDDHGFKQTYFTRASTTNATLGAGGGVW